MLHCAAGGEPYLGRYYDFQLGVLLNLFPDPEATEAQLVKALEGGPDAPAMPAVPLMSQFCEELPDAGIRLRVGAAQSGLSGAPAAPAEPCFSCWGR